MEYNTSFSTTYAINNQKSIAEEFIITKETLKKKVEAKNLQLKNLLKTNLKLLKNNDITTMLLF